jgi:putative NADH-flavin reductase
MKIAILGVTGATGRLLSTAVLDEGHEVNALVRNPASTIPRPGLTLITGDARDADAVTRAMEGAEVLVSAIGSGSSRRPDNLILETTEAVLAAAARTGLRRVVFQSAFGVGDSYAKSSFLMHVGYHVAPGMFIDKAAGETLLRQSDLDWTLVYPGVLTNKPKTGNVTATDLTDLRRLPGMPRIPRADVASFLLETATSGTWNRRIAVLTVQA